MKTDGTRITRRGVLGAGLASGAGIAAGSLGLTAVWKSGIPRRPKRNIILIIHDALRADRLGRAGYRRTLAGKEKSLTPFLDRLAGQGVLFERALAPSSWTPVSMGAMLYDTAPMNVFYDPELSVEPRGNDGLAKALADAGCFTAAVVANPVLDAEVIRSGFHEFRMLAKPRDDWAARGVKPVGTALNANVARMLNGLKRAESFFLYLHYMDTHDRYTAPPDILAAMGFRLDGGTYASSVRGRFLAEGSSGDPEFLRSLDRLRAYYDASVKYADSTTRALFTLLDIHRLLEDTLVIITSDHGEEFADGEIAGDRNIGHGYNLCNPAVHCPLILWSKRAARRGAAVVSRPVSTARILNDSISNFRRDTFEDYVARAERDGDGGPVYGFLHWKGRFSGFYYVEGGLKIHGHLDDGRIGDIQGFQTTFGDLRKTEIPAATIARVKAFFEDKDFKVVDPDRMDRESLRVLRALGYL
ncbi:MAG: sulfatase-like hydrolase/transferase [Planctomycetota bacterium]|jgi:hypothetical protein